MVKNYEDVFLDDQQKITRVPKSPDEWPAVEFNCYDQKRRNGYNYHRYGPLISDLRGVKGNRER